MSHSTAEVRVAVIVPAHNAARWIERALASVVQQTYRPIELIVVVDNSTDETFGLAVASLERARDGERFSGTVLRATAGHAGAARNAGLRATDAPLVAFLDDDDRWEPAKLTQCVDAINAGATIVCHAEYWESVNGDREPHVYSSRFRSDLHPSVSLLRNNPLSTSAVVMRRSLLDASGVFDEHIPSAEDYDLWMRCALVPNVQISFIDTVLGTYWLRPGSESANLPRRRAALRLIGERYGDRVSAHSPLGRLERWAYTARCHVALGLRRIALGDRVAGLGEVALGAAMWPFRPDWVRMLIGRVIPRSTPSAGSVSASTSAEHLQ